MRSDAKKQGVQSTSCSQSARTMSNWSYPCPSTNLSRASQNAPLGALHTTYLALPFPGVQKKMRSHGCSTSQKTWVPTSTQERRSIDIRAASCKTSTQRRMSCIRWTTSRLYGSRISTILPRKRARDFNFSTARTAKVGTVMAHIKRSIETFTGLSMLTSPSLASRKCTSRLSARRKILMSNGRSLKNSPSKSSRKWRMTRLTISLCWLPSLLLRGKLMAL